MTVEVGLFPHCCGAKLIYGFPQGYLIKSFSHMYLKEELEPYIQKNNSLQSALRAELKSFFDEGFSAHSMGTAEKYDYTVNRRDRRAEGSNPLDKNAWVFAITNDQQDHLCRSVLEEFNFKCIDERINPNSGHHVYLYLLTPTW